MTREKAGYSEINDRVLEPLKPPGLWYLNGLLFVAALVAYTVVLWIYMQKTGLHVTGLNIPSGWGVFIGSYVFWIAIAMAGTFISAFLYLARAKFRASISRAAETMTVIAVMIAGTFPLIHLGRVWVVYYMIPYKSELQLWPNFMSPLVWDMFAIFAYMVVSDIFYYTGVIPDAATARDYEELKYKGYLRTKFHKAIALGWQGAASQWRHYKRAYLFFAVLAAPLAVSIHSVTSWDYSMQLLPGWHTTLFAPYFVSGAILSGCAMAITLLVLIRKGFGLEKIVTREDLSVLGLIMIPCSIGLAYEYAIEPFMGWFSGDIYEKQFNWWEPQGYLSAFYWSLFFFNLMVPLTFIAGRLRNNLTYLFIASLVINVGMWMERFVLTAGATSHDFLPQNWGIYSPSWVEMSITMGAFAVFALGVLFLLRLIPGVSITDVKELVYTIHHKTSSEPVEPVIDIELVSPHDKGVVGNFSTPETLVKALSGVLNERFRKVEVYSPFPLEEVLKIFKWKNSPVRFWTLGGTLLGVIGGFVLSIWTASVNDLIVGGKHPVSIIPYIVIAFELGVLSGAICNFLGFIYHARLGRKEMLPGYDLSFSRDKFGLFVASRPSDAPRICALMTEAGGVCREII